MQAAPELVTATLQQLGLQKTPGTHGAYRMSGMKRIAS